MYLSLGLSPTCTLRMHPAGVSYSSSLRRHALAKTVGIRGTVQRTQHMTRNAAPGVSVPNLSKHSAPSTSCSTSKEISSLHPRTASCNEEAAAISLQQAATHMFDYNRLSHSTLPSARAQGERNEENTSTKHKARTQAP